MKKQRLFFILSAVCFLVMIALTLVLATDMRIQLDNLSDSPSDTTEEGLANFGIALGLSIIMVLLYAYAIVLAGPFLLKGFSAIFMKKALVFLGIFFDAVILIFHAVLCVSSIVDNGFSTDMLWLVAFVALPAAALTLDILGVRCNAAADAEPIEEAETETETV
ncbi:MAG: hypothetical protein IKD45_05865 [Clostridia bacterium]|nr:hypothetical protein [Clostridia bacterium]